MKSAQLFLEEKGITITRIRQLLSTLSAFVGLDLLSCNAFLNDWNILQSSELQQSTGNIYFSKSLQFIAS